MIVVVEFWLRCALSTTSFVSMDTAKRERIHGLGHCASGQDHMLEQSRFPEPGCARRKCPLLSLEQIVCFSCLSTRHKNECILDLRHCCFDFQNLTAHADSTLSCHESKPYVFRVYRHGTKMNAFLILAIVALISRTWLLTQKVPSPASRAHTFLVSIDTAQT